MWKHKHVTLHLVWQEDLERRKDCRYSRLRGLQGPWQRQREVVPRQVQRACEKLLVNSIEDIIPLRDPEAGEVRSVFLFVAVPVTSNHAFAEPALSRELPEWIGAQFRAL